MYLEHLSLTDFRSYAQVDLALQPGVTVLVGSNGLGKTNLVESIGYLSTLASHRVSSDTPLLRFGCDRAIVRAQLVRGAQKVMVEVEINSNRANRARINRANPIRSRDILGLCRSVLFAPEDLALVKGDPANRRRFLDDLLVVLHPKHAGTRADYDKVLKQRNALLKTARSAYFSRAGVSDSLHATLDVWDGQLAGIAARLLAARLELLELLRPFMSEAYEQLTDGSKLLAAIYRSTLDADPQGEQENVELSDLDVSELEALYLEKLRASRNREFERGMTLIGPHRDEVELLLGPVPAKGYASHGESWSVALAMRLASFYVLVADSPIEGNEPILILDDVFAELDSQRRKKLAQMVAGAQQVLVTAAVAMDIPEELSGAKIQVIPGGVVIDEG